MTIDFLPDRSCNDMTHTFVLDTHERRIVSAQGGWFLLTRIETITHFDALTEPTVHYFGLPLNDKGVASDYIAQMLFGEIHAASLDAQ